MRSGIQSARLPLRLRLAISLRRRAFTPTEGSQMACPSKSSKVVVVDDTTIDVQVFPENSTIPPPVAGPITTGFVYEKTPDGRKPLRGATPGSTLDKTPISQARKPTTRGVSSSVASMRACGWTSLQTGINPINTRSSSRARATGRSSSNSDADERLLQGGGQRALVPDAASIHC
jgi:hypothetical protein